MESLDSWLERQYRHSARALLASISRVDLVKTRAGFGHSIRAARGSIIASAVLADWNPEPDYFFHWFRDSAVIIDALRLLYEAGDLGAQALVHVEDFVRFSQSLQALDGRKLVDDASWRSGVKPDFTQFVRDEADLAAIQGAGVVGETRVNPDGSLDISRWARPQYDGAPLRALALLRWLDSAAFESATANEIGALVRSDLAFTARHWQEPSFDMWEEEEGLHYHACCVSAAALDAGAAWLETNNEGALASDYSAEARAIRDRLDAFWLPDEGFYRSRILKSGQQSAKELDIAVAFAAIHAQGTDGPHTPHDPRIHSTLAKLEALFGAAYAINRDRPPERGPAMGRYAGDVYFSGGAYYFSTLAAAELCYRAAGGAPAREDWIRRGDGFLETVRAYTPPSGDLSEQFDQTTGAQTSARQLGWSYAAVISCVHARRTHVQ